MTTRNRHRFQIGAALAVLLLSAAGLRWIVSRRPDTAAVEEARPVADSPWAPLFDSPLPSAQRVALARKLDSSFDLSSLPPWIQGLQLRGGGAGSAVPADDQLVYNEILDQARQRGLFPASLSTFLSGQIADSTLDPVLRDYAVQQLSLWLSAGGSGQPAETDPAHRQSGVAALLSVVRDGTLSQTTMPGTALLALAELSVKSPGPPEPSGTELDAVISGILADWNQSPGLRISTIQAAASLNRLDHLPALRELLNGLTPDQPEYLAVISALGRMGDDSDRALLQSLPASSPMTVRAVTAALRPPLSGSGPASSSPAPARDPSPVTNPPLPDLPQ